LDPDKYVNNDYFNYCLPNGEVHTRLYKNSVKVTAVEYVPYLGSILVGFNFGGFQIWNVENLQLV